MEFLHYEVDAGSDDVIEVTLDRKANVRLLDTSNFKNYVAGDDHNYRGGRAETSPFRLVPPSRARWHVVIDMGEAGGKVKAGVKVLTGGAA